MKLFELDTETLLQQVTTGHSLMSGWYSFEFELPVKLTKEDAMLIASRVASMADGVLTHFDYVEYGTGEDDDYYVIVIFFETENKAHNALKVLRRVSRGKPSFEWDPPTGYGIPIVERELQVWGNMIEPLRKKRRK